MVKILGFFLLFSGSANLALACSSPRYQFQVQIGELDFVLRSSELSQRLIEVGAQKVDSINASDRTYTFKTNNGCSFSAQAKWAPPVNNGMCPSLSGVELSQAVCQ